MLVAEWYRHAVSKCQTSNSVMLVGVWYRHAVSKCQTSNSVMLLGVIPACCIKMSDTKQCYVGRWVIPACCIKMSDTKQCYVGRWVIPACCIKMSDTKHPATLHYITYKWRPQLINIQRTNTNTIYCTITSTSVLHLSNYTTQQATVWHETCSKSYNKHAVQLNVMWYCQTLTNILYNPGL